VTANPLVAGPVDTSTAFGGAGLLDSLQSLNTSLQSGDWLGSALSGVGVALDTVATAMDPLGSLIAAGLGWLIEHLEPLKGWLNDLTGDAGAVLGFAGTWDNVAAAMNDAGDELNRLVRADLEAMSGASIAAYTAYANGLADRARAAGSSATAMGSALRTCSTIVQAVHDLVRDTLSQIIGGIISGALFAVVTVGAGAPKVVADLTARVASVSARIGRQVTAVVDAVKSLKGLLGEMGDILARLAQGVRGRRPGASGTPPVPRTLDTPGAPTRIPLPDIGDIPHPKDGHDANAWAEAVAELHPTLNSDEVLGIYRYTTVSGYDEMNSFLRQTRDFTPEDAVRIQADIDNAVSGMGKLPQVPGVTLRGSHLPEHIESDYVVGNQVADPAFWSTSQSPAVAERFRMSSVDPEIRPQGGNAYFTISGRSGVDVQQLSHFGNEAEILMAPGTPFIVRGADPDPRGFMRYELEEAP